MLRDVPENYVSVRFSRKCKICGCRIIRLVNNWKLFDVHFLLQVRRKLKRFMEFNVPLDAEDCLRSSTSLGCSYHAVQSFIPEGEKESCTTHGKRSAGKIEPKPRCAFQNIVTLK
jgi:hypothetical protein